MKNLFVCITLAYTITTTLFSASLNTHESITKNKNQFREYEKALEHVEQFYRLNHTHQTLDFARKKQTEYGQLNHASMSIWEAMELLDTITDESDPDLNLPQSYHAYQTAEALRKDNQPDWLVLTGFIHDLGKILITFGEPQWAVVGDTFPLGCQPSTSIVYYQYFNNNPDTQDPRYNTLHGIYTPHCGLENVTMSWGHDEYLYHILKNSNLPKEALFIIRYHSFYAAHREDAYHHLMNESDKVMMQWLKLFSQYDLYSKDNEKLNIDNLKPYYQNLIEKFLPGKQAW